MDKLKYLKNIMNNKALQTFDTAIKYKYLYPAGLFVTNESYIISTVLGSCVSVCLFDTVKKIAAINHFMLSENPDPNTNLGKYGDTSLELMLQKILTFGTAKNKLKAKIFGGGKVMYKEMSSFDIGEKNIEKAFHYLKEVEIPVINYDVGGKLGRKIIFDTQEGIVKCKYINNPRLLI